MPEFCGFGGYCLRLAGHKGAHTPTPPPSTREWDRFEHDERVLEALDFETPAWADLLDPDP